MVHERRRPNGTAPCAFFVFMASRIEHWLSWYDCVVLPRNRVFFSFHVSCCLRIISILLFTDVFSFFRHFKWFTEKAEGIGRSHFLYKLNGVIFLISFFAVRILPLFHAQYAMVLIMEDWKKLPVDAYWISYVMFIPAVLNVYWGYLIFKMASRAIFGYKPKKKGKSEWRCVTMNSCLYNDTIKRSMRTTLHLTMGHVHPIFVGFTLLAGAQY